MRLGYSVTSHVDICVDIEDSIQDYCFISPEHSWREISPLNKFIEAIVNCNKMNFKTFEISCSSDSWWVIKDALRDRGVLLYNEMAL